MTNKYNLQVSEYSARGERHDCIEVKDDRHLDAVRRDIRKNAPTGATVDVRVRRR
jgi:hypothetical protein